MASHAAKLSEVIQTTALCDTHEHLGKEDDFVQAGPDILQSLFDNYVRADLVTAGASEADVEAFLDPANPDIAARMARVQSAWDAAQHTGYGEATRAIARLVYGIEAITPETVTAAQARHAALRAPGERLRLLREVANLDHVQVDDFDPACKIDPSGPDFFFYDISWWSFATGRLALKEIAQDLGLEVTDLASLQHAMELIFTQNAPMAIAVKTQHAYDRTLYWQERGEAETARALEAYLRDPENATPQDRLCLGDWCLARGVELAIEHDLPIKIHTGYYAGNNRMPVDYIRSGNLCGLLARYLDARFVLMHIAYPYNDELTAIAKHYPNVYIDLCWAWTINPYAAADFVRRFIHAVPANKLFAFGGDTFWPTAAVGYAWQARRWLDRALQAEFADGLLSEEEAIRLALRFMRENQYACFRIEARRKAFRLAAV